VEESLNEVYVFDAETLRFIHVNRGARENLGYSMTELEGLTPLDLKPEFTPEAFEQALEPLRSGETEVYQFETIHLRKDGSSYPVEVRLQLSVYGSGAAFVAITLDITERKRAEEERLEVAAELQHAQRLESLSVLAGGVAHDFNNLLMGVLGNAELALAVLPPESPARRLVGQMEASAVRGADLAKQMLAYSGHGSFFREPLDLTRFVRETTHLLEATVSRRVAIRTDLVDGLPLVQADATQISQALMNLVLNASESMGDGAGLITISTGVMDADEGYLSHAYLMDYEVPPGTYVFLRVSDTGAGMDEETKQKVVEPFFTTKFTGRGLGLAATLGIVRGHEGAIRVESTLREGSTFTVLFPALEGPKPEEDAMPAAPPRAEAWRGTGTVLVADDEEAVRSVGRAALEMAGFKVVVAEDGEQAVELFRSHRDEVVAVLLDLTMPHKSGDQVFGEIHPLRPDVPVILSSGFSEEEATQRFAGLSLAGFLQKPYRPSELIEEMRKVLSRAEPAPDA